MITVQRCTSKDEWDEYVLSCAGHPLQLWPWGQVKSAHGWKAERMFVYDEDERIGGAQVLIRPLPLPFRAFGYIPRGPLGSVERQGDVLTALADFVKREYHAVVLSVEPDSYEFDKPKGWLRSTNKVIPGETVLLDLTKSESDLLAAMAKKTRQYIRKSSADIEIKPVRRAEDLEACLEIYRQTSKRAGFNVHSNEYYLDVKRLMGDYSPIFAAYADGEPVSFLWLAISGETAYELYGGMNGRGQELRANYALKWYAIRKVKEWGLQRYDFGGVVEGGVATFKQGWSADTTLFAGSFDRPLSPFYTLWSKGLPFAKRTAQRLRRKR